MNSRSFIIFCTALIALSASAQVHRCKDGSGKLIFSDRPCDVGQAGEQILRKPSPAEIRQEREQAFQAEARKQDQRLAEQEREWHKSQGQAQMPLPAGQQPKDDWQSRKDRENTQTSSSSITNNQGRWDAKAEAERAAQRREELRRRQAAQKQFMLTCTAGMCTDEWGATYSGSGAFLTRSDGRSCSVMGNTAQCQ